MFLHKKAEFLDDITMFQFPSSLSLPTPLPLSAFFIVRKSDRVKYIRRKDGFSRSLTT